MSMCRRVLLCLCLAVPFMAQPAAAISLKQCSVKYQAAKKDGSLANRNWDLFRKQECPADDKTAAAVPDTVAAQPLAEPVAATPAANGAATAAAPQAGASKPAVTQQLASAVPAGLALPDAIDPKYAAEKPSRGRLHTCSDAYQAHKKQGALNGLRWIQPGGGFYSLCVRKLKAAG